MIKMYFITLPTLLIIDMIWLNFIAKDFYNKQIGYLMSEHINWIPALLFYLIYSVGLIVFVINPAIAKQSLPQVFIYGAFFGFVAYSAYDLTNFATIKDWSILVTIVDMFWGAFLSGIVSLIVYLISIK